ncbi:hypothetical protein DW278_11705 [Clostridium botulinum]|nr:hypothetical protein [Clostridium botulinum]
MFNMKINIRHISNTFNYGSFMMAITLIEYINLKVNDVKFYVDTFTANDLERLKKETGVKSLIRYNIPNTNKFTKKCINKLKKIKLNRMIKDTDIIIIIGGDDISEYYGVKGLIKELNKFKKESLKKNIILLGQTMGPFTDNRGQLAKECLSKTKVYTRDDKNFNYLCNLEFSNVKKGRDLAFAQLPMQYKAKHILKKYNLIKDSYITVVTSGLTKCYTDNLDAYLKEEIKILENILVNKKLIDKKIVLLPHVLLPEHVDDRLIIKEIMKKIDNKFKDRIIDIYDEMLPSEAREILGNGLFTITGRMHAAVSTFYMRKPAISLSYSIKYSGVIGDGLDMNELVIESANEQLWSNGEISKLVDEKVNYILENYDELIKKIDVKVLETSRIVEEELEDVVNQIKNRITN